MQILSKQKHLFLNLDSVEANYETTLEVLDDFDEVLSNWHANSRVSPIWRIKNTSLPTGGIDLFPNGTVFFISMINPAEIEIGLFSRIEQEIPSLRVLSTLGIFNILLSVQTPEEAGVVKGFLRSRHTVFEEWILKDNVCTDMHIYRNSEARPHDDLNLNELKSSEPKLRAKNQELAINIQAAISRSSQYLPWVSSDLQQVLVSYKDSLEEIENADPKEKSLYLDNAYYLVINANSAISRFTSQALSGIQPITSSEGHYWPHSALGIGIANTGARKVAAFISKKIGEFDFSQRISDFSTREYPFEERPADLQLKDMQVDLLGTTHSASLDKINPICFFSGRDNFKHDIYSLSLPLETIDAAMSHQWSLQTMTHELTHRIIEPIQGLLLPRSPKDLIGDKEVPRVYPRYKPENLLDAARIGYLDALLAYANCQDTDFVDDVVRNPKEYNSLYEFIILWNDFVEEFIVHTFDFLYFYGSDPGEYIQSLWLSWGIIPHLENKLDDYIARTIVALSSNTMHLGDGIEAARQQFIVHFDKEYIQSNCPHFDEVLKRVKNDDIWESSLKQQVIAGNVSARFVLTFLYSAHAHTNLFKDTALEAGDGYGLTKGKFSTSKYTNPLRLMKEFSRHAKSSPADSSWLFHMLTFNIGEE